MLEKICKALFAFMTLMSRTVGPMYICLGVFKPELPMLLRSLSSPMEHQSLLKRAVYIVPFTYITLTWWSNLLLLGAVVAGYVFSTLIAIYNLR